MSGWGKARAPERSERLLRMGHWLASTAGLAAIAIDGPHHGDRVPAPMAPSVYQQLIVDEGIENVTARMTGDWLAAVSALAALRLVDDANVGVFGMSMSAPVLYHVQWDDAIFPRDGQFELFDALASTDKRLIARPGPHSQTHPDDEASWQEFTRRYTARLGSDHHHRAAQLPDGSWTQEHRYPGRAWFEVDVTPGIEPGRSRLAIGPGPPLSPWRCRGTLAQRLLRLANAWSASCCSMLAFHKRPLTRPARPARRLSMSEVICSDL